MLQPLLTTIIFSQALFLTIQSLITLAWMIYAWENPEYVDTHSSPKSFTRPRFSFTALIPARHEAKVIEQTISAVSNINYPQDLKEIIVINTVDDIETVSVVQHLIRKLPNANIRHLVLPLNSPKNKPHNLNQGLRLAHGDIVTIFDAEDQPHPDIYNIINTVMITQNADVVQSGVQLMNYNSSWFSTLNVLEYFLWFKSGLHFFTNVGNVSPLGGNTVFFKRVWLNVVNGWDENNLTEDADIGIRLTIAGAKTRIVYDEQHATQEETPDSIESFIKQRTRWHQGFLQILFKKEWLRLPSVKQKLIAAYILIASFIPTLLTLYVPFGLYVGFIYDLPVSISILSYIPMFMLALIIVVQIIAFYEFKKAYRFPVSIFDPFRVLITFLPYVIILGLASLRAMKRILISENSWEKTEHINAHRAYSFNITK